MNIAIDLLEISSFKKSYLSGKKELLDRIFTKKEIENATIQHMCGIFCVKECCIKLGVINNTEWTKIEVLNDKDGKPILFLNGEPRPNYSISITHTDSICAAVVLNY